MAGLPLVPLSPLANLEPEHPVCCVAECGQLGSHLRAVLEARAGVPVTEVAERYGVSRQSVHTWLGRYQLEGITGLEDRSHRVRAHPWRISAEVEEAICELRRKHPRWAAAAGVRDGASRPAL